MIVAFMLQITDSAVCMESEGQSDLFARAIVPKLTDFTHRPDRRPNN
jgi:hypothetical protein